jgi:adenylate cyclase
LSETDEIWRHLLEGTDPDLSKLQRFFRRIPSAPRCKMCAAPFGRPGSVLLSPFGWRRWAANPALCKICARGLDKARGGAEILGTFLFADIRGSTTLAERLRPADYRALLDRFYAAAAWAIDDAGGLIDKYLGDGVVAMFVPVFSREAGGHPAAAIRAGRSILERVRGGRAYDPIPVGVGVHTGLAYVGVMGVENSQLDFTGVGDTVNTAARLGSVAGAGELLVSTATAEAAGLDTSGLERRTLELKGKEDRVEVVVVRVDSPSPTAHAVAA